LGASILRTDVTLNVTLNVTLTNTASPAREDDVVLWADLNVTLPGCRVRTLPIPVGRGDHGRQASGLTTQ
jgi:hypothetical protein